MERSPTPPRIRSWSAFHRQAEQCAAAAVCIALAGRINRNWYAVYVQTPREEPTVIDAVTQRVLSDTLTLANQLGAMVFTFKGIDVADTILRFAQEYRVGQVVIGRPRAIPRWRRLLGAKSVAEELLHRRGA